jgi:25S rRNA (uracil2843-N3)-methyltransferase
MAPPKQQKDRSNRTHQIKSQHSGTSRRAALQQRPENDAASLPVELQQMILDVFRRVFPFDHDQHDLRAAIQEVKGHLFQRDFSRAFAKPEYLDAYALRWSASRALGYTSIFLHGDLQQAWSKLREPARIDMVASPSSPKSSLSSGEPHSLTSACRVVCIGGGGGAEVAACAAAARTILPPLATMNVHVVDIADWSTCLQSLANAFCAPPELSAYASESAKMANKAFVSPDAFDVRFSRHDILAIDEADLAIMLQDVRLCTIMFTLNELFSTSITRATAFLLALTESMSSGSWLLVVDSPGSYSEVKLGKGDDSKTKEYPMKWLLDHTLLEVACDGDNSKWTKVVSDDSRWFRLNQQLLKYPIELENMRYQIHLYQRV